MRTITSSPRGVTELVGRRHREVAGGAELAFPAGFRIADSFDAARVARALLLGAGEGATIAVYVDNGHRVKAWARLTSGWLDAAFLPPSVVLDAAERIGGAAGFVIARMRTEGAVRPLEGEGEQAARLRAAGERRGMAMLDHIVVGRLSSWSLHDEEAP